MRSKRFFWSLTLLLVSPLIACGLETDQDLQSSQLAETNDPVLKQYNFDYITPTGLKIFKQALAWKNGGQLANWKAHGKPQSAMGPYPLPGQCANNVSHVLTQAGLGHYANPWVKGISDAIAQKTIGNVKGVVKLISPRNKLAFINAINSFKDHRIPTGAVVLGCYRQNCTGQTGDGHVSIVGDVDQSGVVYLYHNNWYRPDNENGAYLPHMVSKEFYYTYGLRRQWMATPWMKLVKNSQGEVVDIINMLPAIDDLDPLQSATNVYLRIAVPAEILIENPLAAFTPINQLIADAIGKYCYINGAGDAYANVRKDPSATAERYAGVANSGTYAKVRGWLRDSKNDPWASVEATLSDGERVGADIGKPAFIRYDQFDLSNCQSVQP